MLVGLLSWFLRLKLNFEKARATLAFRKMREDNMRMLKNMQKPYQIRRLIPEKQVLYPTAEYELFSRSLRIPKHLKFQKPGKLNWID